MRLIAVTVCTFNRPQGLKALLTAVDKQRLHTLGDEEICIVVVDNSAAGSAEPVCSDYARTGRFRISRAPEPRKGLAFARNAALSEARRIGATHVVFIDDDEVPEPSWLDSLHTALERSGAAAAVGPVYPIFETPPTRWVPRGAYVTMRHPIGGFVTDGYTGNTILSVRALDAHGLTFNTCFNDTGGEDTIFFRDLGKCGEKIAAASDAIAYELVPSHRMSPRWLWRRWFRTGLVEAHLGKFEPTSLSGRAVNFAKGIVRLLAGSIRIVAAALLRGWDEPSAVVASFFTSARGAGLIAASIGKGFKEYADKTYR